MVIIGRPAVFAAILAAWIMAAWVMAGGTAHADAARSKAYLEEARKLLQKDSAKAALIELKNAVQSDPDNLEARYELGALEMKLRDLPSAVRDLETARDRGFDGVGLDPDLADCYIETQQFGILLD